MGARIFLGIQGLLLAGYGLACLFSPAIVADASGIVLSNGVAGAEVRAMYGGLQASIGVFALVAAAREDRRAAGLLALAFVFGGLALGRAYGVAVELGPGSYNWMALGYEAVSAALAIALMRGAASPTGATTA